MRRLAESPNPRVRRFALDSIGASAAARSKRQTLAQLPMMSAIPSPAKKRHRLIYDVKKGSILPGTLVRSEGDPKGSDPAVNEAYNYSGATYDFYLKVFGRNSLDGHGVSLLSSVHYRRAYNNAFWNGEQMTYGDGDGIIFQRFTRSLDVVAHELSHGVVTFTSNLDYQDEPGALNEHFADVMGTLVKQWRRKQTVRKASWLIGEEILVKAPTRRALRDMAAPGTAYQNDPDMGDDPQPAHVRNQYKGNSDYGGVHINSGIPNHAFYTVAMTLGGRSWEKAGRIWYQTLLQLTNTSQFQDCATVSHQVAGTLYRSNSTEQKAVATGWKAVGITV